jgi:euchromatic histone-lysine N-methyltransferase
MRCLIVGPADTIRYTGDGGNDLLASGSQIKDQEDVRGNRALIRSNECKLPVRVIRGHAEADGKYNTYDGLYCVDKYTYLPGQSKHKVFRFHMKRLGGQKQKVSGTVMHKMVGNMGTKYTRWHNQYNMTDIIDVKTGKRKDKKVFKIIKRKPTEMKDMVCKDISDGQERRPIPVFNDVDDEKLPVDFRSV